MAAPVFQMISMFCLSLHTILISANNSLHCDYHTNCVLCPEDVLVFVVLVMVQQLYGEEASSSALMEIMRLFYVIQRLMMESLRVVTMDQLLPTALKSPITATPPNSM